ncbi:phage head morphogenesis protein [Lachnospiraceae bacterium ZAX-1]
MVSRTSEKIQKTARQRNALGKLRSYLDAEEPKTVEFLTRFWGRQRNAITYQELREAFIDGGMTESQLEEWQLDYADFVRDRLAPQWESAMRVAAQEYTSQYPYFLYDPQVGASGIYARTHGAELATNLAQSQIEALRAMVTQAMGYNAMTTDDLARMMRACIGLTKPQAIANLNYYNGIKNSLTENHPKMKPESVEKKAREAAAKYAARQHRYRAQNIARTELANAYNQGAYGATMQAQADGYIGECRKVWLTADDERTCEICGAIDGESVAMDAPFSIGVMLPVAHPSCRCAVAYEEVTEPVTLVPPQEESEVPESDRSIDRTTAEDRLTAMRNRGTISNIGITGASGAIPRSDSQRMTAHAELYYEEIRRRKSDIEAIAKNTGYSKNSIALIKNHIFIKKHDLDKEIPSRFDPDYDMAVSWQHLIDGKNIREMDLVLLGHELAECKYMKDGMNYFEAHKLAEKEFNYSKYVRELNLAEGIR